MRLCIHIIGYVSKWANLRTGPEWREFGYAGPVPIFLIEALVVAQSLHNRARLASDQAPCASNHLLWGQLYCCNIAAKVGVQTSIEVGCRYGRSWKVFDRFGGTL